MSSLDKMWASFVAMGLMVVSSLLITYARTRTTGYVRMILSIIAFILFVPILIYMLLSLL
jgi:Na+-driven multidrug efflux pump